MIERPPLDPGERLIWSGNPLPVRYALRKSWTTFLFGLVFFGFSIFWVHGAYHQSGSSFALFGVPFVVIGAGMLLSPLWHFYRAGRLTYLLTDRRAIASITGPFSQRTSVPLRQIKFVELNPNERGEGDIYFKDTVIQGSESQTTRRDGFIAILDAVRVDRLLRKAIEEADGKA